MKRLWIDDMREPPDESWIVARKVQSAINILGQYSYQWDEISLDHDIENRPSDETFNPVARYIALMYGNMQKVESVKMPKITIHSINPVGAKEMQQILKDYGIDAKCVPYGLVDKS